MCKREKYKDFSWFFFQMMSSYNAYNFWWFFFLWRLQITTNWRCTYIDSNLNKFVKYFKWIRILTLICSLCLLISSQLRGSNSEGGLGGGSGLSFPVICLKHAFFTSLLSFRSCSTKSSAQHSFCFLQCGGWHLRSSLSSSSLSSRRTRGWENASWDISTSSDARIWSKKTFFTC